MSFPPYDSDFLLPSKAQQEFLVAHPGSYGFTRLPADSSSILVYQCHGPLLFRYIVDEDGRAIETTSFQAGPADLALHAQAQGAPSDHPEVQALNELLDLPEYAGPR